MTKANFPKPTVWLNVQLCKGIYEAYKQEGSKLGGEPLPNFDTRFKGKLESILESAKIKGSLKSLDLAEVAAYYYTHITRSQAFTNGNKRMGIVLTSIFLHVHGYKLLFSWNDLMNISLLVAVSSGTPIGSIEKMIKKTFNKSIIKIKQ